MLDVPAHHGAGVDLLEVLGVLALLYRGILLCDIVQVVRTLVDHWDGAREAKFIQLRRHIESESCLLFVLKEVFFGNDHFHEHLSRFFGLVSLLLLLLLLRRLPALQSDHIEFVLQI